MHMVADAQATDESSAVPTVPLGDVVQVVPVQRRILLALPENPTAKHDVVDAQPTPRNSSTCGSLGSVCTLHATPFQRMTSPSVAPGG